MDVSRIDNDGNLVWNTPLSFSTPSDNYTYSEFEEITIIEPANSNLGFLVTGSIFGNANYVGIYTLRISWSGAIQWSRVNDEVSAAAAGTPVTWVNNAILTAGGKVFTTWRKGPVSAGGPMFGRFMDKTTGVQDPIVPLNNVTLVREAFATRAHGKLVIGGTRGDLNSVYAYANGSLLLGTAPSQAIDEVSVPNAPTVLGYQTNVRQLTPEFQTKFVPTDLQFNPASRQFYTDLRVFPNPASGVVNVGGLIEPGATLRVVDMNGRIVAEQQIQAGDQVLNFDLTGRSKGIYTVQMLGANGITSRKVVVE
jgi:hypothetical protein